MNRRSAMLLAGGCAFHQVFWLAAFTPLLLHSLPHWMYERVVYGGGLRLLSLHPEGFGMQNSARPAGWVPQFWFVVVGTLLAYAVFRASPGLRPRARTVAALIGASLLAAGSAELLVRALDTTDRPTTLPYGDWFIGVQLRAWSPAPALYALWASWIPVLLWSELWLLRRWRPVRELFGTSDDSDAGRGEQVPLLSTKRERRDAVVAGLIPVVLCSIAGGQVLRHVDVHETGQPSVTFDPERWLPYQPPPLVDRWSGVLYPALRMRPLATENLGGWLATLAICLVTLAVLAFGLRAVARSASRQHRMRTFMECWYVTLLAATSAALVESVFLRAAAPRPQADDFVAALGTALANAVRFGTVWGWVFGGAFLGTVVMLSRHGRRKESPLEEGRVSHAG